MSWGDGSERVGRRTGDEGLFSPSCSRSGRVTGVDREDRSRGDEAGDNESGEAREGGTQSISCMRASLSGWSLLSRFLYSCWDDLFQVYARCLSTRVMGGGLETDSPPPPPPPPLALPPLAGLTAHTLSLLWTDCALPEH